ncbi:hypothetical protein [Blastococcus capsensis]|uniref:hypothetical protein n=1 Tax=Blastococcus capsensis TaxID=1564163 RepID=UPI002541332D|nr:hypothetical protein [Blastococcus capsensis]MDK3255737.1 hypothetical protein [Blastococcus capsensis]
MHNAFRVGAAGLAVTFFAAGCAEAPRSVAAPPPGSGAPSSTGTAATFPEPEVTAQEAQTTALDVVGGGWIAETTIEEGDRGGGDWDDDDWDDDFEAPVDVWEVRVVLPDADGTRSASTW